MSEQNNLILVDVEATYLDQESDPDKARYLFAYTITIKNHSQTSARLLSRYWKITGGDGNEQEVEGDGVVGEFLIWHQNRNSPTPVPPCLIPPSA